MRYKILFIPNKSYALKMIESPQSSKKAELRRYADHTFSKKVMALQFDGIYEKKLGE